MAQNLLSNMKIDIDFDFETLVIEFLSVQISCCQTGHCELNAKWWISVIINLSLQTCIPPHKEDQHKKTYIFKLLTRPRDVILNNITSFCYHKMMSLLKKWLWTLVTAHVCIYGVYEIAICVVIMKLSS